MKPKILVPPPSTSTNTSSPGTRSQKLYLDRRHKREQRRSLKESGDYLGVQGVNPSTGEMDVLTPSSSSTPSSPFASLARSVQDKREAYERARRALRSEKTRRWEMDKKALKAERKRKVKWTKASSGWSSVIEPGLSPISGSSAATTPGDGSTATVVRTPRHRSEEEGSRTKEATSRTLTEGFNMPSPAGTLATSSASSGLSDIRRKSVPTGSDAFRSLPMPPPPSSTTETTDHRGGHPRPDSSPLGHWVIHSDRIPIDSGIRSGPPPKSGFKPVDKDSSQRSRALSAIVVPSDSISVADAPRLLQEHVDSKTDMSSRSKRHQGPESQQRRGTSSSTTSRQRSVSSALDFRSRATPETHLDVPKSRACSTGKSSNGISRPSQVMHVTRQTEQTSNAQFSLPSDDSQPGRRISSRTFKGEKHHASRADADSKVCLHTHHHHYWIVSDPTLLQKTAPELRSSKDRKPLQQVVENHRFKGTINSWPSEGEIETLAESQRPPSETTNQRYFIAG